MSFIIYMGSHSLIQNFMKMIFFLLKDEQTPLHIVAKNGNVQLVQMFVKSNADIHATTKRVS